MTDNAHLRLTTYGLRLPPPGPRRAAVLLLTLLVVAAALMLALPFLASQGTTAGVARNISSGLCARAAAETASELTFSEMRHNPHWRTDHAHGVWVGDEPFSAGSFTIMVEDGINTNGMVDGDGDLANDSLDPVTISTAGQCDGVQHQVRSVIHRWAYNLLMVVPTPTGPTFEQQARRALFESWGHHVTLISENATQAQINAALAVNHVVYVVGDVRDDALGRKLTMAPVGVVVESNDTDEVADDLGLVGATALFNGSAIVIANADHYITDPLPNGTAVTLCASLQTLTRVSNNDYAVGATVLAKHPSLSSETMLVYEAGTQLHGTVLPGAEIAAARRVLLPWGGSDFDIRVLTDAGRTILKRAVHWAAGSGTVDVFVDNAVPDATYEDRAREDRQIAQRLILPEDGTLTSISVYLDGAPPHPVRFAVYSDRFGEPHKLLAESQSYPTQANSWDWVTGAMPPTHLEAGAYWLAFSYKNSNMKFKIRTGSGQTRMKPHAALENGFLDTWGPSAVTPNWDLGLAGIFVADAAIPAPLIHAIRTQPD